MGGPECWLGNFIGTNTNSELICTMIFRHRKVNLGCCSCLVTESGPTTGLPAQPNAIHFFSHLQLTSQAPYNRGTSPSSHLQMISEELIRLLSSHLQMVSEVPRERSLLGSYEGVGGARVNAVFAHPKAANNVPKGAEGI